MCRFRAREVPGDQDVWVSDPTPLSREEAVARALRLFGGEATEVCAEMVDDRYWVVKLEGTFPYRGSGPFGGPRPKSVTHSEVIYDAMQPERETPRSMSQGPSTTG